MSGQFPLWMDRLANCSLLVAGLSVIAIVLDEMQYPQKMWIMNLVWPLTAIFGSLVWLVAYWRWGRNARNGRSRDVEQPFAASVLKSTSHCGAGCTVGDLAGEWLAFVMPGISVWFGWHSVFSEQTFANWIFDFVIAFIFGIGFQYFTIKPMRNLSVNAGLAAALKADLVSIVAWQIGMYGVMAVLQFNWFKSATGRIAPINSSEFWLAMQIAMLGGFATSYPVNWLLLRIGWKEKM
jgi:hypothetical protein